MTFGHALATACVTFAITNIDDAFVLVTFFTEASTSRTLTPLKITIGQYIGFTIIIMVSMIGFGVSLVLPSEPIGFLGLLPILLGVWKALEVLIKVPEAEKESSSIGAAKSIFKVSGITVMNGGDNIGTYIPLFSQAKGVDIAVYVVTYYILLGVWCLAAFLVLRQKHILRLFQKYAAFAIPLLYVGLGIYIVVKSECYPWSIQHINDSVTSNPGTGSLAGVTAAVLLTSICCMTWYRLKQKKKARVLDNENHVEGSVTEDASGTTALPDVVETPRYSSNCEMTTIRGEHKSDTVEAVDAASVGRTVPASHQDKTSRMLVSTERSPNGHQSEPHVFERLDHET